MIGVVELSNKKIYVIWCVMRTRCAFAASYKALLQF